MNPSCWSAVRHLVRSALVATCAVVQAAHAAEAGPDAGTDPTAAADGFSATTRHLVPGGVVYGCIDFAGDAAALRRLLAECRDAAAGEWPWRDILQVRLEPLVDLIGLSDLEAAGASSVVRPDGLFDNRTFFYMPRGRHGLLEGLDGEPGQFDTAMLAPRDVDLFYESRFDLSRAYRAVRVGAAEMLGAQAVAAFDEFLADALAPVGGVTVRDLVEHARGRLSIVGVIEEEKTAYIDLDVPIKVPACHLLMRIEGMGQALIPLLDEIPVLELSIRDGRRHYAVVGEPWLSTWTPAIVIDRDVVYLGSSQAFILACIARKDGLATDPQFVAAVAELGGAGNAITWMSPRLTSLREQVLRLNESSRSEHIKDLREWLPGGATRVPPVPLVSVRRNLPDGILYRSRWDASLKRDLLSATLLNPVTLAMSAEILRPHYRRAKERSEEVAIYANLRRLQVNARQYCYDRNLTTVPIRAIMGDEPGKLVPTLPPVAGEDYTALVFRENYTLAVTTEDGRVVEFGP